MFNSLITYTKDAGVEFTNLDKTKFDVEKLGELLAAFDRDPIEIRGRVTDGNYEIDGIKFEDFDFTVDIVNNLLRYLKPGLHPRKTKVCEEGDDAPSQTL